jgi:hypothetical protein
MIKHLLYSCILFSFAFISNAQDSIYKIIARDLAVVDYDDQVYRNQMDETAKKFGADSKEMKELMSKMEVADSLNLIKVSAVLDKYGWLSEKQIGYMANGALFMVIQHSGLRVQEKYLPMMREAVKNGKANAGSLALLEDRIAMYKGQKQIFGSQLMRNYKSGEFYVMPLENPDSVDIRRAARGLPPMAEYLQAFGLKWDLEKYKKELPLIEKNEKARRQVSHLKKLGRDSLIKMAIKEINDPVFKPGNYDRVIVRASEFRMEVEFGVSIMLFTTANCYYENVSVNLADGTESKSSSNCDNPKYFSLSDADRKKLDFVIDAINKSSEVGHLDNRKIPEGSTMKITERKSRYEVEVSGWSTFSSYKVDKTTGKISDASHKHYDRAFDNESEYRVIE